MLVSMNALTIPISLSICFGMLSFGNALGHDDFTYDYSSYHKNTEHHEGEHDIISKILSWDMEDRDKITFTESIVLNQDIENSIHFDGKSDFISFKSDKIGDISKISILVFVKPHLNNANNMTVIGQENGFSLTLNDNGGHHAEFSIFDGTQWISISSPIILKEKETPIFAQFDGSSIKLLVDDVSLVEKQIDITNSNFDGYVNLLRSNHEIVLGASKSTKGFSDFYYGDILKVQFYTDTIREYYFAGILDTFENASEQTAIEPINQTAIEPINQTAIEPINQTAIEPINQTSVEPINQTAIEPINQTAIEPIN